MSNATRPSLWLATIISTTTLQSPKGEGSDVFEPRDVFIEREPDSQPSEVRRTVGIFAVGHRLWTCPGAVAKLRLKDVRATLITVAK